MFVLLSLCLSAPQDCLPGVMRHLWSPNRVFTHVNTSDVFYSDNYNDFGFCGSFCPSEDGNYRMIVDGTYEPNCEAQYSLFSLHNYSGKPRTTPYLYLKSGACYQYYLWGATGIRNSWGKVSIQKEGQSATLFTTINSYNCPKSFCTNDEYQFPECFNQKTSSSRYQLRALQPVFLALILLN